jgi:hypothetical protein
MDQKLLEINSFKLGKEISRNFLSSRTIPSQDDQNQPRPVDQNWPVMAVMWDLGNVDEI